MNKILALVLICCSFGCHNSSGGGSSVGLAGGGEPAPWEYEFYPGLYVPGIANSSVYDDCWIGPASELLPASVRAGALDGPQTLAIEGRAFYLFPVPYVPRLLDIKADGVLLGEIALFEDGDLLCIVSGLDARALGMTLTGGAWIDVSGVSKIDIYPPWIAIGDSVRVELP